MANLDLRINMTQRLLLLLALLWAIGLVACDRFIMPHALSERFWIASTGLAIAALAFSSVAKQPMGWLIASSVLALIGLTIWQEGSFPLALEPAVFELVALIITSSITTQVARRLIAAEAAISLLPSILVGPECQSFEDGQAAMYREVRRARQAERPLSVIAMEIEGRPPRYDLRPLLREVQATLAKQIRNNRAAHLIAKHLNEGDVLTVRNGRFVILLVEADELKAKHIAAQVSADLEMEFNQTVRLGCSSFPYDEITLSGLFEGAEAMLNNEESPADHAEEGVPAQEFIYPLPTPVTDSQA